MKKMKIILTIILMMIGITSLFLRKVEAHSVELDPKSLISFPLVMIKDTDKIMIKDSETNYNLYYQTIEIPEAIVEQIDSIERGKNAIEEERKTLKKECNNLEDIVREAKKAYEEKLKSGVTDTELETLRIAYETAQENFKNKAAEHDNKLEKLKEEEAKIQKLIPTYVENNWIKTEDRSYTIDLSEFSGKKTFALWVKLISSDGTISYDVAITSLLGRKKEEMPKQEEEKKNDMEIKPITSNEKQNDGTVSSKKLPQTGTSMVIISSIFVMLLIVAISYKKYNNYKKIK